MSSRTVYIAAPESKEQVNALKAFMKALKIKFEVSETDSYNPEFVAKIKESEVEYKSGNFIELKAEDIDSYLGLK